MLNIFFDVPKELRYESGIYKISNDIDNKIYVGRTINFRKRYLSHRYSFQYLNGKIQKFIEKNPDATFKFEIIEITNQLEKREEYWIKKLKSVEEGFNRFHSDQEYINFYDNSIYLGKFNIKKITEKRKNKIEKQNKEHKKDYGIKYKKIEKYNVYKLGYVIIKGQKYDYLGNKIKQKKYRKK